MSPWIEDIGALGDQLDDGDLGEWIWDGYNIIIDKNNDGNFSYNGTDSIIYAVKDGLVDNITSDINNDGLSDTVDFHIENQRVDLRFDYDFSKYYKSLSNDAPVSGSHKRIVSGHISSAKTISPVKSLPNSNLKSTNTKPIV